MRPSRTAFCSRGRRECPRIYYRKSTDADAFGGNTSASNGWKFVVASNASSPYNFTIDYSLLNGGSVSTGNTIEYFVVAQDAANNLSSNPAGATSSANPPVQNINAKPGVGVYSYVIAAAAGAGLHTATLLPSGKVMVAVAVLNNGTTPITNVELYDPPTNTFGAGGSLGTARYGHTATLLSNGKVLAAGGFASGSVALSSVELYDPTANTWSVATSLSAARRSSYGDAVDQWQCARRGRVRGRKHVPEQSGTLYPIHKHVERRGDLERRPFGAYGNTATQRESAGHGRIE